MYQPKNKQRGQSLVEMAVTLPVLILILSGLLDLGRIYFTLIALEEATAEGALYIAVNPNCVIENGITIASGNENRCSDPNNALYRARTAGNREVNWDQAVFNINPAAPADMASIFPLCPINNLLAGCEIVVQVRYTYDFLTPGIEAIANGVSGGNGLVIEIQSTNIILFPPD